MALKALDQRLANNTSPVGSHTANGAPSQPRPTNAPTGVRLEGASPPPPPPNGRSKSSEQDESAQPKAEKR